MNDVERWIYFGGQPPEHIERVLQVLRRDAAPETPEDLARECRGFRVKLDAMLGYAPSPAPAAEAAPVEPPAAPLPSPDTALWQASRAAAAFARWPLPAGAPPSSDDAPPPPVSLPPALRHNPALVGTADLSLARVDRGNVLPFAPAVPGQPHAPPPRPPEVVPAAAKTLGTPARGADFGKTAPLDGDMIRQAIAATVPFKESTVGPAVVFFPDVPIYEYASLCAELFLWPHKTKPILVKYKVLSPGSHTALDEHWRQRFAQSPRERAEFEYLYAYYNALLRTFPMCPYP